MNELIPIKNALLSVFDKTGLDLLAPALHRLGVHLYSTGGTATYLESTLKIPVTRIEALTQFPEMMEGRVKTLHPRVFGGILARRENSKDIQEASEHGIPLIDLVVVNLYPFGSHLNEEVSVQSAFVDIGGPSMLRAAAKNHASVTVLSEPGDYGNFIEEVTQNKGSTSLTFRRRMAVATFERTSAYDSLIASEWAVDHSLPTHLVLTPQTSLRYGENPHQKAAWSGQKTWEILQGKELSYNNLLDGEAAVELVREFKKPAVVIVKHNNPCGVATSNEPEEPARLFQRAFQADNQSAFGGIVAVNFAVDGPTAKAMSALFLEVIIAEEFTAEAKEVLSAKKNLRLIRWPTLEKKIDVGFDVRKSMGGWLLQESDGSGLSAESWKPVTKERVTSDSMMADLQFAWLVCKHVRSNAIVLARHGETIGIGAGQMSRIDSVRISIEKGGNKLLDGTVLASDAFFPFRDNIDKLKGTGVKAIVQPGGSQRDAEVIQACDELGIAMYFTGERHFKH